MRHFAFMTMWLLMIAAMNAAAVPAGHIETLRQDVDAIGVSGVPGPISVFGEAAFAVIAAEQQNTRVPVVAAAEFGQGRVVAFGHTSYVNPATLEQADTRVFFENSIRWTAGDMQEPVVGVYRNSELTDLLVRHQFEAVNVDLSEPGSVDVLIVEAGRIRAENVTQLQAFVAEGGGLVTAGLGWGWKQLNPGKSLTKDFMGNRLLLPMGLAWADGYAGQTCPQGYRADAFNADLLNASTALSRVNDSERKRSDSDNRQISTTLMLAVRSLPETDTILLPRIQSLAVQSSDAALPTTQHPLREDNVIGRLLISRQVLESQTADPQNLTAHPAATFFPGSVEPEARRIAKSLTIDTSIPRWHCTGLYAAPGEPVTVSIDPAAAGHRLQVRIGAHTDGLWHKAEWKRCPDISRRFTLEAPTTVTANAFGGLIYLDVPDGCPLGTIDVSIDGAVEAPLFVQGKTDLHDWRETIRKAPGPWAELASDKIIVTVPSAHIRELDDPASLMSLWDAIMDACADLATIDRHRRSPERIVADVQISAGYMHSGYPIMTHADQYDNLVNCEHLREGNWGLFHELGHNHQNRDWTFEGTGEVTVNLFTTYVYDRVCGVPPEEGRVNLQKQQQDYARYVAEGRRFEQWKSDPFLALVMYLQLQQQFGWDTYQKVFAEYRALTAGDRPKSDAEKRDQWMVRFSKAAGRNLGPFFDAWNVPVSEKAKEQVAELPVWLPESLQDQAASQARTSVSAR